MMSLTRNVRMLVLLRYPNGDGYHVVTCEDWLGTTLDAVEELGVEVKFGIQHLI